MTDKLSPVNEYIAKSKGTIEEKYRLVYHMAPPVGWMNDPNGLIFFQGKYHLYYQFNPYATEPGIMYWGHFISNDLISYTDGGAVLAPEGENESIFSGGAIEADGKINAFYTLHIECGDLKSEETYMAVSSDGTRFSNLKKVFDNENLPENISRTDFRDPCPVKIGDKYFVFVGGKDIVENKGVIVVLGGKNPDDLKYEFHLRPFYELGDMGECPSYFKVDGKDVIIASGCNVPARDNDFKNINSSVFIVGDIDFERGGMQVDYIREIDKGDTFYAPQFIRGLNKPVMIGWLEMWSKYYPTHELKHGWVGAFSIPREISIKDGNIFQSPVESLNKYHSAVEEGVIPKCADITFEFDGKGSVEIAGDNGKVILGNDGHIYLDTRASNNMAGDIRRTDGTYKKCSVRVLLDISSIEVFVDGGREVISSRIYIDGKYSLKLSGGASITQIKQIGRKQ